MRFLKLFLIYAQIILEAKNIIIPITKYNPSSLQILLTKLYRTFPKEFQDEVPEAEFVSTFMKYMKLLQAVADLLWYLCPELMHQLTWKYVFATQAGWKKVFDLLRKYAQESAEALEAKITEYKKLYNEKVLLQLIEKDLEIQLLQFDYFFKASVQQEIDKLKKELSDGKPPEGANWLFYIDGHGMQKNPNWDINK